MFSPVAVPGTCAFAPQVAVVTVRRPHGLALLSLSEPTESLQGTVLWVPCLPRGELAPQIRPGLRWSEGIGECQEQWSGIWT